MDNLDIPSDPSPEVFPLTAADIDPDMIFRHPSWGEHEWRRPQAVCNEGLVWRVASSEMTGIVTTWETLLREGWTFNHHGNWYPCSRPDAEGPWFPHCCDRIRE